VLVPGAAVILVDPGARNIIIPEPPAPLAEGALNEPPPPPPVFAVPLVTDCPGGAIDLPFPPPPFPPTPGPVGEELRPI
jgi:hypothetical protein